MMTAVATPRPCLAFENAGVELPPAVGPLVAVLGQLAELIESMSAEQYTRKPVGVVPSSVGGHVRHNLDHVQTLLDGLTRGVVDYDDRRRGTDVEADRGAAVEAINHLCLRLRNSPWPAGDETFRLTQLVAPDAAPVTVWTTLDRELAFVLSHTIHHNALIGTMARLMGVPLPPEFGYAPSTLAHRRARPCVR
jgi:uncharacterized damage-inducible protein DinB